MTEVMEHSPLPDLIASLVQSLGQVGLGSQKLLVDRTLRIPVQGAQGVGSLEHEVLQVVSCSGIPRSLHNTPKIGEDLARHPMIPGPRHDQ